MANYQVKDLVNFVLKNRKGKAFQEWTADEIALAFSKAFMKNEAAWSINKQGEIDGVIIAHAFPEAKILYIENILTTSRGVIKSFLQLYYKLYPGFSIEARRRGKYTSYKNTEKLLKRMNLK